MTPKSGRKCRPPDAVAPAALALLWLIASALPPAHAHAAAAATRAALVGGGQQRVGEVLSLAEARLAEAGAVRLVERREVDRVLAEQKLSASGMVAAEQAVGVGKILSAEILAVLESESPEAVKVPPAGGGPPPATPPAPPAGPPGGAAAASGQAGLVVFDVGTGVRLWDVAVDLTDGARAAEQVADAVTAAQRKRQRAFDLRPVCVLAVRNADLPRGFDGLCDAAGRLFERNLVAAPSLALLERSRLDQVNREAAIAGRGADDAFLASVVLVELEVGRRTADGGGEGRAGLRAAAVLTDGHGKSLGKAEAAVDARDAAALAVALAQSLAKQLKVVDGAAPGGVAQGAGAVRVGRLDRAAEAARFHRESLLLASHQDFARAIPPAEAALALVPEDHIYQAALAVALVNHGHAFYETAWWERSDRNRWPDATRWRDVPPSLLRGAQMLADVGIASAHDDPAARTRVRDGLDRAGKLVTRYIMSASSHQARDTDAPPAPAPDLAALKAALRRYLLEVEHAEALAAVKDQQTFALYTRLLPGLLADAEWCYSRDVEEWSADLSNMANTWLDLHAKYVGTRPRGFSDQSLGVLEAVCVDWLRNAHRVNRFYSGPGRRLAPWELTDAARGRFGVLIGRLAAHPDPRAGLFAELCQLSLDVERVTADPQRMRQLVGAFVASMKARIADPKNRAERRPDGGSNGPDLRRDCYRMILCADQLMDRTPFAGTFARESLDFMLARKEIVYGLLLRGYYGIYRGPPDAAELARQTDAATRVLTLLDDPACEILEGHNEKIRSEFTVFLQRLRKPDGQLTRAAPVTPWTRSLKLVDVFGAKQGRMWVVKPVLDDANAGDAGPTAVYAAGLSDNRKPGWLERIELLRFPLDGGQPKVLGTADIPAQPNNRVGSESLVTASCLHANTYAAGTYGLGAFLFPADGRGEPIRLDEAAGLPSPHVTAAAGLGGKFYFALGREGKEGYLVSYDPATGKVHTVASSRRKDERSPFDDGTPFLIRHLVADPDRGRLIVAVERLEPRQQVSGLWEFKPAETAPAAEAAGAADGVAGAGTWRLLLPVRLVRPPVDRTGNGQSSEFNWGSPLQPAAEGRPAQVWLMVTKDLFLFDLERDRAEVLYRGPGNGFEPRLPPDTPWHRPETVATRVADNRKDDPPSGTFAVQGDWVWTGPHIGGWGRRSLTDGRRQECPMLRDKGMGFHPSYLQPLPGGRLLVGDGYGLWVLTLPPGEGNPAN